MHLRWFTAPAVACLVFVTAPFAAAAPLGAGFTYQGRLEENGVAVNGTVDMSFSLWNAEAGPNQIGSTQMINGVTVDDGVFTVPLNTGGEFGTAPFSGDQVWLEISVNGTPLSPRQALTAAPYASFSLKPWSKSGNNISYVEGNVGIGTAAPSAPLHVADQVRVEGSSSQGARINLVNTGGGGRDWALSSKGDKFVLHNQNGLDNLIVDGNGKIGMGITPSAKLHVYGGFGATDFQVDSSNSFGTWSAFRNTNTGGREWDLVSTGINSPEGAGKLVIRDASAGAVRMLLDTAGSVGIGTTSPTARLHVVDGPGYNQTLLESAEAGGTWLNIQNTTTGGRRWSFISTGAFNTEGAGQLLIRDETSAIVRMICTTGGNVGIGTTAPSKRLEVAGPSDTEIGIKSTDANGRLWTLQSSNPNAGGQLGGSFQIVDRNANASRVLIATNGNVGIGTTAPGDRLTVAGNICASGLNLLCSDARYKTNVQPVENALKLVEKLRAVRFDWKRGEFPDRQFSEDRQIGLIAQEVQKVAPEVVQKDANGYLAVDYSRLTPILIEAVQEQQKQIESKDEELDRQAKKVEDLEARLARLEKLIASPNAEMPVRDQNAQP